MRHGVLAHSSLAAAGAREDDQGARPGTCPAAGGGPGDCRDGQGAPEPAGGAVELGVVMLVYLNQAIREQTAQAEAQGRGLDADDIRQAVINGAVLRVRPILMTVAATIGGLLPIMFGSGTGSEVMRRIAAPMVGGMVSATILTLLVIPALFLLWRQRQELA